MTFALPVEQGTVELSRGAIRRYERDRRHRAQRRLALSIEVNDPSLGPGMWP